MDAPTHKYFSYEESKPGRVATRRVVTDILNSYLKSNLSKTKLKKMKKMRLNFSSKTGTRQSWQSKDMSFSILEDYITKNNKFNFKDFDACEIKCPWLDGDVDISLPQHFVGSDGKSVKIKLNMPFGNSFPIEPILDREGILFNSFQNVLADRIISLHNKLIAESVNCLTQEWLYDLITLISNSISLVDITLNQLYIKAEYDPLPCWKFDKEKLGERHAVRLVDKFRWINKITGNPLDNIEKELESLKILKNIRNHTQHFDPPCFGFALEDVKEWLNMINDVGSLLLKIRKKIGSEANEKIYEIILLPRVKFKGVVLFDRKRLPLDNMGYASTCWK